MVGVVLVNGMAIATLVIKPRGAQGTGSSDGQDEPDTRYSLDVSTTPNPLKVTPDGKATATVFAQVLCTDPKVDTGSLTASIGMSLSGAAAALAQSDQGTSGPYQYIRFTVNPPQPGQTLGDLSVNISVYVEGSPLSCTLPVPLADVQGDIETQQNPADKNTLTPGFKEEIWIYAKVNLPDEAVQSGAVDAQAVKSSIHFDVMGGDGWVAKNDPQESGEWVAWLCQLMDLDAMHGAAPPSEGFTVRITATLGAQQLQKDLSFQIAGTPQVWTKPDQVFFLADSGKSEEVTVWIENPGDAKWTWRTEFEDGQEVLADAVIEEVSPGVAKLTLTEKHVVVPEGQSKSSRITIDAEVKEKDVKIQGSVYIEVGREGIFVEHEFMADDGSFHVAGDGKKQEKLFRLRVMAWDPAEKRLTASKTLPQKVEFEVASTEELPQKLAEFGEMAPAFKRLVESNLTCGEYGVSVAHALPLDTEVTYVEFSATVTTESDKELSGPVKFGLGHDLKEIESNLKEVELQRCYQIIDKYVSDPTEHDKLRKIVDDYKDTLGAEGMYALRHQVWEAAVKLLIQERDGYLAQAAWYDKAVMICEWAEWAGDLAFTAALAPFAGPVALIGASSLKGALVSAIVCFKEGKSFDDWAWQQLGAIPSIIEGVVVDPDQIGALLTTRLGPKAMVAAWCAFIGYHFLRGLGMGKSLVEAVKYAATQCTTQRLGAWLCQKCHASVHGAEPSSSAGAKPSEVATKPTGPEVPTQPTGPEGPTEPTGPEVPTQPTGPEGPTEPTGPEVPTQPTGPEVPTQPTGPEVPTQPTGPEVPTQPTGPEGPTEPTGPEVPTQPTGPEVPTQPTGPEVPTQPTGPEVPTQPTGPEGPTEPTGPEVPTQPTGPEVPTQPTGPEVPTEPTGPEGPTEPTGPEGPTEPTSPEGPTKPETPSDGSEPPIPPPVNPPEFSVKPPKGSKPAETTTPEGAKPTKPTIEDRNNAWDQGQQEGSQKVDRAMDAVQSGDPTAIRDTAIEMQGDKQGLYEINRQNSQEAIDTRLKIKQEIKDVYNKTDQKTCADLAKDLGVPESDVRAKNITNAPRPGTKPKDPTKVSYDRDVTYERKARPGELIPDESTPGKWREAKEGDWVDIPAEDSASVYNKNFKDAMLDGASQSVKDKYANTDADDFAHAMDQTVTDRLADDAYGRGPSDLATACADPTGDFSDPNSIARTVEYKADEWYQKADKVKTSCPADSETYIAEGMRQTTKQYDNLVNARLYALTHPKPPAKPPNINLDPPPALTKGIEIMEQVDAGKISPVEAEGLLKQAGTSKEQVAANLGDFVRKVYSIPVPKP